MLSKTSDKKEKLNYIFFNRIEIILTLLFFLLIVLVSLIGLSQLNQVIRSQNIDSLQTVLNSTHASVHDIWFNELFLEANNIALEPIVINSTKSLLSINRKQKSLLNNPTQQKLRNYFRKYLNKRDAHGIFIISPDAVSLASMRDINIGDQNLIKQYYPKRLEKVFLGENQFIPPIPSDIPLPDVNNRLVENYPSMFILVPIKNESGQVIAALGFRLNPFGIFTKIAHTGRLGKSGETYFVDSQGRMITESRFTKQLWQLGILKQGEHSLLSLYLREPSNNIKDVNNISDSSKQQPLIWVVKNIIEKHLVDDRHQAYYDYRGVPVLGVGMWDEDLNIGFVTEIDEHEAMESYRHMLVIVIGMLVVIVLLGVVCFYILHRFRQSSMAAITNSETYLGVVLDNAVDGIITINEQGNIQMFNSAAEKLFGYLQSEVINKNVNMLVPEPYQSEHDSYLDNYKKSGEAKIIGIGRDVSGLKKDGSCFPMRLGISETCIDNKKIFISIIHDLTKQKQAEEALQKSESRFREIYQCSPVPYQSLNDKNIFVEVNKAFIDTLGYTRDEIIGKSFIDILDEESAMRAPDKFCLFQKDKKIDCEFVLYHKDGSTINVELHGVIGENSDGTFKQTHCVWQDISNRKKIEQKIKHYQQELESQVKERTESLNEKTLELEKVHKNLLKSERLYRGLLEAAPDSIVLVNEQGNIELVNKTVTKMLGYTPEELLGKPVEVMLPERYIYSHKQIRIDFTKQPYVRESHSLNMLFGRRKDGSEFPVDISLSPIETENGPMVICDIRDISERIKLGEQLQQAQKMESIGQLTGGIAHDFNNILGCILGYTTLALELGENPEKEKLEKYLKIVHLSGQRASDLISKMMAFSRRNSSNPHQVLNLTELLDEIITMLRPMLPSSIDIICNIESNVSEIVGNPEQIIQVVTNLCLNARDAIQDHGCIQLQLSQVTLIDSICNSCHENIEGDFIEIIVTDNGVGIDDSNQKNIFDPFFTTKEVGKGTGMGLSMVHGILHDNGGHILVNSTFGEGTTFCLLFPCLEVNKTENKLIEEKVVDVEFISNSQHILIVDDEKMIVNFLEELLINRGYQVTSFSNSEVALDFFVEHKNEIDLVITDQTMPKITGTEMAQAMFEIKKDIPIILCSGNLSETKEISEIKKHFLKPVDTQKLLQAINDIF